MHEIRQPKGLVVAGHSHLVALAGEAWAAEAGIFPVDDFQEVFILRGPQPREAAYWVKLKELSVDYSIALLWGGNEHNLFYFFEDQPFDFISKHIKSLINVNIVPQRMVKEKFNEQSIRQLRTVVGNIREASADTNITILGTPPPKRNNIQLKALLNKEAHFQQMANQLGLDLNSVKIRAPHVRLKLWFLLQDMLAEVAYSFGGKFVSVPDQVQDRDGFLLEEYWYPDVTHANEAYGKIMLRHVMTELNKV